MLPADSVLKANPVSENTVYPKTFKKNVPSRYKGNEFDYSESKPRESFWAKLVRKIKNIFRGFLEKPFLPNRHNLQQHWLDYLPLFLSAFYCILLSDMFLGKMVILFLVKRTEN